VNFVLFSRDGAAGSDEQNRLFLPKNSGLKRPIIIFPTRKGGYAKYLALAMFRYESCPICEQQS